MKNKELIKFLCDFSPDAEVKIIANDVAETIVSVGWSSDSDCPADVDSVSLAKEVYLHFKSELDRIG